MEGREAGLETADLRQLKRDVLFFLEKNQVERKTPDTPKNLAADHEEEEEKLLGRAERQIAS